MADDNTDQVPQSAIPPKAVPPQARPATDAAGSEAAPTVRRQATPPLGGTSAPIPRTVRLRPVASVNTAGTPAASATPGLPPVTPAAPTDTEAAAVKRMTARIVMMSNEVDPLTGKKRTGQIPAATEPGAKKATAPLSAVGGVDGDATVKMVTSRIQMSTTVAIPDLGDTPKTIKIRPLSGTQPVPSTQPISVVEPPVAASQPFAQQMADKAKTSRIPLESAMSVPQSGGASAAMQPGGSPKTIKLKRPGEMSTIKVSVPGAGAAPAAGESAGEPSADHMSITQKKTIRVKRPTVPAAASAGGGGAIGEPGISTVPAMSPVAFAAAAPERGTGWFIALAVACILIAVGVAGVLFVQLYGSPPNTQLDAQFQHG